MKRRLLASIMTLVILARDTGSGDPQEAEDTAEPAPKNGEEETPTPVNTADGKLDLADGSIVISATGYTQGDEKTEIQYTGAYIISQTSKGSTTNTITVTGGDHQITLNDVNIDLSAQTEGIPCAFAIESGNVTLMLADESVNTLKSGLIDNGTTGISCAGLWVGKDATLTINSSEENPGKLTAVGGGTDSHGFGNSAKAAGIGASRVYGTGYDTKYNCVGDITITGGIVEATGSKASDYGGPGIGGGNNNSKIIVNGGKVIATSGKIDKKSRGAAGIGSAYGQNGMKTITITGGEVKAMGNSAGIGGGAYRDAGTILITGGTVIAQGGPYGAGIGGGGWENQAGNNAGAQASGNITISGGIVTATGGQYAPGIGSGAVLNHNGKTVNVLSGRMGAIVISGGSVTATNGSDFVAKGGKSYKTLDDGGVANVNTGIGQGVNASEDSQTAFVDWTLKDGNGETIIEVEEFSSNSPTL